MTEQRLKEIGKLMLVPLSGELYREVIRLRQLGLEQCDELYREEVSTWTGPGALTRLNRRKAEWLGESL